MKLRAGIIFFSLAPSTMAAAQAGSYVEPSYYESAPRSSIIEQYHDVLKAIRKEALNQQASDGGHLSYNHLNLIQHKIDEAHRHYQNAVWRIDNGRATSKHDIPKRTVQLPPPIAVSTAEPGG